MTIFFTPETLAFVCEPSTHLSKDVTRLAHYKASKNPFLISVRPAFSVSSQDLP